MTTPSTAVTVKNQQLKTIKQFIDKAMPALHAALPKIGMTEEALARTAFTTIIDSPHLHGADPKTLVKCIIEAAQLGLSLDKNLGHAYLVPFKGKVQLMPGYQGFVALMDRSSIVRDVVVECVYDGDLFEYEINMERDVLRWKPITKPKERTDEKLTHAFAIIRLANGGTRHRVLDIEDLHDARARSAAYQNNPKGSPWATDFPAMCRKTAIRRVSKISPMSPTLHRALALDDQAEAGQPQALATEFFPEEVIDVLTEQASGGEKSTVEKLRDDLVEKAEKKEGDEPPPPPAEGPKTEAPPFNDTQKASAAAATPPAEGTDTPKRGRGRPKKGEAPGASSEAAATTSAPAAPAPAAAPASKPVHKGDVGPPPKARLKELLGGDAAKLKQVSLEALTYERESFDDVFEREAVAIIQHIMSKP